MDVYLTDDFVNLPHDLQNKILLKLSFEELLTRMPEKIRDEAFLMEYVIHHHLSFRSNKPIIDQLMRQNGLINFIIPYLNVAVPYYDKIPPVQLLDEDHWAYQATDSREAIFNEISPTDNIEELYKSHLTMSIVNYILGKSISNGISDRIVLIKMVDDEIIITLHFSQLPNDDEIYAIFLTENLYGSEVFLGKYNKNDAIADLSREYNVENILTQMDTIKPKSKINKAKELLKYIEKVYDEYPYGFEKTIFPDVDGAYVDNSYFGT